MAITIRLTDEEKAGLQKRVTIEGISIQDAARRAVRAYVAREDRRERVLVTGKWLLNIRRSNQATRRVIPRASDVVI